MQRYRETDPGISPRIGLGGTEITAFANPPLSTVFIPNTEMGREAVDLLLARIASRDAPAFSILREAQLVIRASTVASAGRGGAEAPAMNRS